MVCLTHTHPSDLLVNNPDMKPMSLWIQHVNSILTFWLDTEFRYRHTQISNQNLDIKHSNLSFTKIIAGFNQPKEGKMKSKLEIEYYHKHDSI